MKGLIEIPENVREFEGKCERAIGRYAAECYDADIYNDIQNGVESPIEQLFLYAFKAICRIESGYETEVEADADEDGPFWFGMIIKQQDKIGKYRADFCISYNPYQKAKDRSDQKAVVVELDGHEFHDKDERQRRYEKARDRFFQKNGYVIFHYTGSEICRDPLVAASEVFSFLTEEPQQDVLDYVSEYFIEKEEE